MSEVAIKQEPSDASGPWPQAGPEEATAEVQLETSFDAIRALRHVDDTVVLERAVDAGVELARELAPLVSRLASPDECSTARKDDGLRWEESIDEIISLGEPSRMKIGVVGATGSGKSSLVNAILGEEGLLPTSCEKACTAWVTEVSYNDDDDDDDDDQSRPYRGEIEFSMKDEIASGSTEYSSPGTEAGVMLSRLASVYPGLTAETMAASDSNVLMEDAHFQEVLGRTISLADVSAKGLAAQMQPYMGGRSTEARDGDCMNPWPLIKVVRVMVKAAAPLDRGRDCRPAAVATNYMKDCSGIWIVAPIVRAVDDKSARDLLGGLFRHQLPLDNKYSAISFVCSKTDDVNADEMLGEPGLAADMKQNLDRIASLADEIPALEEGLEALKEQKRNGADVLEECRDQLDDWEAALGRAQEGQPPDDAATANAAERKRIPDGPGVIVGSAVVDDTGAGSDASTTGQPDQRIRDLGSRARDLRDRCRSATAATKEHEERLKSKAQRRRRHGRPGPPGARAEAHRGRQGGAVPAGHEPSPRRVLFRWSVPRFR
ncbi:hypothetical protein LX36DRAFT_673500 [Colletotrichum falcatum]|nr:hypothetical protein LX36DRAFT_673500 [Colletotrichum falcatum]